MENYSYNSGESSPRSRDVDFEALQPWEDQSAANNYKVKFMCSYGGKIHPRPHDNQLSYVGGETKILAFDRFVKFATVNAKLTALCDGEVCCKYQLPGEDLDALISVSNDDDVEHMMHEYDRLTRASPSPARLRLFLFPVSGQSPALTPVHSFGSTDQEKSERERFMEPLNSGHPQTNTPPSAPPKHGNVEVLLGSDKAMTPQPSEMASRTRDGHIADPQILRQESPVLDERAIEADRIQKHIQDLQRLRITEDQQPALYRRPSDDNLAGGYTGEYHVPKMNEKITPTTLPGTVTDPAAGYQISNGFTAPTILSDQQVYMIPAPASMYHAPIARPVVAPTNHAHGYYVQGMPTDVYRDQPVYNVTPPQAHPVSTPQTTMSVQQILPPKVTTYTEGYRMVHSTKAATDSGYAQVAYDGVTGRQVYYTPQGAVVAPSQQPQPPLQSTAQQYQAMAVSGAMTVNQESAGNVVQGNMKEFM